MPEIRILPSNLINQIAAGEVIERPASIVKELIENAIDATASQINIVVKKGGIEFIQVSDNGVGMTGKELDLSFQRHATSKISTIQDLTRVSSLGFRGEALPSIASVARVTAVSAVSDTEGNEIKLEGGEIRSNRPSPAVKGTQISVSNLFFNVPARRKFLKKSETEYRAVVTVVRQFMLANPEIGFSLIADDREVFQVKPADLENRLQDIYGRKFVESILPVSFSRGEFSISGYVGSLSLVKKRIGEQYLYMNGRAIKDRLLNSAVFSAYRSLISRGEYPFFVLNMNIPLDLVDVNVHPAKLEVRFQDEWRVYYVVKSAVTEALKDVMSMLPDFTYNPYQASGADSSGQNSFDFRRMQQPEPQKFPTEPAPHRRPHDQVHNGDLHQMTDIRIQRANDRISAMMSDQTGSDPFVVDKIWQIHDRYLVTEVKSGLIIIDQHVAHERILFEAAKKAMDEKGFPSQTVLFPQTVKLQPEEFSRFLEIVPYLEKIGFRLREFGENSIIIDGVPPDVYMGTEDQIIRDILEKYMEQNELGAAFLDYIAATYACKAAIKAGDRLEPEEMRNLLDKLFATEHPYYCPHGRPIVVNLTTEELDRRFERI